jgi:hypothetical protein
MNRPLQAEAYDAADNGRRCYDLARAAAREQMIRCRQINPRVGDAKEARWAVEGPVPPHMLETARNGG